MTALTISRSQYDNITQRNEESSFVKEFWIFIYFQPPILIPNPNHPNAHTYPTARLQKIYTQKIPHNQTIPNSQSGTFPNNTFRNNSMDIDRRALTNRACCTCCELVDYAPGAATTLLERIPIDAVPFSFGCACCTRRYRA